MIALLAKLARKFDILPGFKTYFVVTLALACWVAEVVFKVDIPNVDVESTEFIAAINIALGATIGAKIDRKKR